MFSILKYTNNQRANEIFQPLFMCFWSLFHLVLRLFQPPNQGADNSETSVAWTFMQSFFRQCFKCTWSNKKITKNVWPHVGPTSFPSRSLTIVRKRPKSFSLEVWYISARYMTRRFADEHLYALRVSWTKSSRDFQNGQTRTRLFAYTYI